MTSFNPDLIDDLARQRVVLFLGSGVSASATTRSGQKIKQWSEFLNYAAEKVGDQKTKKHIANLIKSSDYLMACELLRSALDDKWQKILIDEFSQVADPSDLHKAIVRLDQRIILTTNFDKILQNTWNSPDITVTHHPTMIAELDASIFRLLRDDNKYLIKLHGSIDRPDTIIFTKENYNKYAYGSWIYRELLGALLLTHTFVFIGFSMSDPAVSFIIEMHAQKFPETRPHYIFVPGSASQQSIDISKKLRRLYIVPYSPKDEHKQLVHFIEEIGGLVRKRRAEIKSGVA